MDQESPHESSSSQERESGRLSRLSQASVSRRSLLRAGAAATPVVLTFASGHHVHGGFVLHFPPNVSKS
jgi:hypothetical protein